MKTRWGINNTTNCCCTPAEVCPCIHGEDYCCVTVQFKDVLNAVYGINPPGIYSPGNPATEFGICYNCGGWNREWQLHYAPWRSSGRICVFVTLQSGAGAVFDNLDSRDNRDTCFPCQSVCDDTGLQLVINCQEDGITAQLDLVVKGCQFATWFWGTTVNGDAPTASPFTLPDPAVRTAVPADDMRINYNVNPLPPQYTDCYVPEGRCWDNIPGFEEGFPCSTSGIHSFYDVDNCLWPYRSDKRTPPVVLRSPPDLIFYPCPHEASGQVFFNGEPVLFEGEPVYYGPETCPSNPTDCDECADKDIDWPTSLFVEINSPPNTGIADDTGTPPADCAIDDDYWELRGAPAGADPPQYAEIEAGPRDLPDTGCPNDEPLQCLYDVLLRYYYSAPPGAGFEAVLTISYDGDDPDDVFVVPYNAPAGGACSFDVDGGGDPEFIRLGSIFIDSTEDVTVTIRGSAAQDLSIYIDHLIFRRL